MLIYKNDNRDMCRKYVLRNTKACESYVKANASKTKWLWNSTKSGSFHFMYKILRENSYCRVQVKRIS